MKWTDMTDTPHADSSHAPKFPSRDGRKSICVFCGSSDGNHPRYVTLGTDTGIAIAEGGYRMVYGGGGLGLMGASARAAHAAGGDVLGIIPEFLRDVERLLEDVQHEVVDDMPTRKKHMYEASDAFIVLPGGIGTLEEAVEIMSWMRLQLHKKPMVFLDNDGYWAPLVGLFDHTIDKGFAPEWMRDDIFTARTPAETIAIIERQWENPTPLRTIGGVTIDKV